MLLQDSGSGATYPLLSRNMGASLGGAIAVVAEAAGGEWSRAGACDAIWRPVFAMPAMLQVRSTMGTADL